MSDSIIERLRKHYTGRVRKEVSNPCITAREAIEIANHISALEQPCNCELVVSLRRNIDTLESELAERWENLNVQDGVIDGLQEEIAALRAAAIQPVMSRQGFGTPGTIEFYRCVFCNHDARTPDIDHDSDCVVREAGYLGGVE